jgi:hypothetical protein
MNSNALRAQMILKGVKAKDLCNEIGISKSAFARKMSGSSDFTRKEIQLIIGYLNIDDPMPIFFDDKVS